jgi:hypothetical protein
MHSDWKHASDLGISTKDLPQRFDLGDAVLLMSNAVEHDQIHCLRPVTDADGQITRAVKMIACLLRRVSLSWTHTWRWALSSQSDQDRVVRWKRCMMVVYYK